MNASCGPKDVAILVRALRSALSWFSSEKLKDRARGKITLAADPTEDCDGVGELLRLDAQLVGDLDGALGDKGLGCWVKSAFSSSSALFIGTM